jgi:hypothetical protein
MKMQTVLTRKRLLEVLDYDPMTGGFWWKTTMNPMAQAGDLAGFIFQKTGYRVIGIDGKYYQAQRLAWLIANGVWPQGEIDHENHIRDDNRILNLKDVPRLVNQKNKSKFRNNTSGYTGVYATPNGSWIARICVNRRQINLGTYPTIEDAVFARAAANSDFNFHSNHGL